jgi:hypothetical protein
MKHLLGLATIASLALAALAIWTGMASATTLSLGGVAQNSAITITASLKASTTATLQTTDKRRWWTHVPGAK